jgi:RNA polymerase subunit RPABC4/transcription elongation factor Spt4
MSIHISKAYFCQDCEFIGDNSNQCSRCSSASIHLLQNWLDREPAVTLVHPRTSRIVSHEFDGVATVSPQLIPNRRAG